MMKNPKSTITIFLTSILISGCSLFGIRTTEQAPYKVLSENGSFEVREYPAIVLAQVSSTGASQNESFRELFKYISGENISGDKISMTAPVIMKEPSSQKISMTAPVLIKEGSSSTQMSFVLPKEYTLQTAPAPKSEKVKIVELESAKRLVYTFSGILGDKNSEEAKAKLIQYADKNNLKISTDNFYTAGYNPPWTLPFLRRNEAIIDLEE